MIVLLVIIVFIVLSGMAAFFSSGFGRKKEFDSHFLADHKLSWFGTSISMAAANPFIITPFIAAALIVNTGVYSLWPRWSWGISLVLIAFLTAAGWRKIGAKTDSEVSLQRYDVTSSRYIQIFKVLFYGIFLSGSILAIILYTISAVCEPFLRWDLWLPGGIISPLQKVASILGNPFTVSGNLDASISSVNNSISLLIFVGLTSFYVLKTGLKGVVAANIVQMLLLLISSIIGIYYLSGLSGGFENVYLKFEEFYGHTEMQSIITFGPPAGQGLRPLVATLALVWLFQPFADGTGPLAQRCIACRSDNEVKFASMFGGLWHVLIQSVIWLPMGVFLVLLVKPERIGLDLNVLASNMIFALKELVPVHIQAFIISGIVIWLLAAWAVWLNWTTSYWANDIPQILNSKKNDSILNLYKLYFLAIIPALLFSLIFNNPMEFYRFLILFGAGLAPALVLRWIWERINAATEWTAIVVSLLMIFILNIAVHDDGVKLGIIAAVSTIFTMLAAILTSLTKSTILDPFYKYARPPGFWRNTATYSGHDPYKPMEDLLKQVTNLLAGGTTVYLLILGLGKHFVAGPDDPSRLPMLLIGAGIGISPVWIQGIMKKKKRRFRGPVDNYERLGE